jgi:flagellar hook-associated protein 2
MLGRIQRSSDLSSIANYARSTPVRGGGSGLSAAETYQINQLNAVRKLSALGLNSASSDIAAQQLSKRFGSSSEVKISAAARTQASLAEFKSKLQEQTVSRNPLKVQSSQPELITAKPTQGGLLLPALSLEIKQLAQSQQIQTRNFSPSEAQIGTGKLLIQRASAGTAPIGEPVTINITDQNNTLAGIAQAINGSGASIRAEVLRDRAGSRLELTGKATGQEQGFVIQALDNDGNDSDDAGLSALNFDLRKGQVATRVAQDAKLTIDARDVMSTDNQFEDKISNIQVQLLGQGSVALSFSRDTDTVTKNFAGVVERYNQVRESLLGNIDAAASRVRSQLSDSVANLSVGKGLARLEIADIGLSRDASGKLYLNETQLSQQALAQPESVNELLNLMSEKLETQVNAAMNTQNSFANVWRGLRASAGLATNQVVSSLLPSTSSRENLSQQPLNSRVMAGVMQYIAIAQYQ